MCASIGGGLPNLAQSCRATKPLPTAAFDPFETFDAITANAKDGR